MKRIAIWTLVIILTLSMFSCNAPKDDSNVKESSSVSGLAEQTPTETKKSEQTPAPTETEKSEETPTPTETEKTEETPTPTETEKSEEPPAPTEDEEYSKALALIEDGKYEEAFEALEKLGDFKDAKDLLSRFYYVPTGFMFSASNQVLPPVVVYELDEYNIPSKVVFDYPEGKMVSAYTYDQNGNMIELKVSSILNETGEEIINSITRYTYDENGNMIELKVSSILNETGEEIINSITGYTYDENGNMTEEYQIYPDDEYANKTYNTYDENGKIIRSVSVTGGSKSITKYTYDSKGNMTEVVMIMGGDDSNGEITLDDGGWIMTQTGTFDQNNKLIKHVSQTTLWTGNTEDPDVFEYFYNEDGNLIKTIRTTIYGNSIEENFYDETGNLIKTVYKYDSSDYETIKEYSHNENGNVTEYKYSDSDGDFQDLKIEYAFVYVPIDLPEKTLELFDVLSLFVY